MALAAPPPAPPAPMASAPSKIAVHAKTVAATLPRLADLVARSGVAAAHAVELGARVRALDDRRARLGAAIQATTDVLSLRDCGEGTSGAIAADDPEAAAQFVLKFRDIECAAAAGGAAYDAELAAMRGAAGSVEALVKARYFEAAVARDDAALERWLPLLAKLGIADDATADAFLEHFRHLLREAIRAVMGDEATAADPLARLQRVINAVAAVVAARLADAAAALPTAGERALELAHDACEAAALSVAATFAADSRVASYAAEALRNSAWPSEGDALGLDALDALLDDVATALQRLETWRRFARHAASATLGAPALFEDRTRLDACADELGEWYRGGVGIHRRSGISSPPKSNSFFHDS